MSCDICAKDFNASRRQPLCASCARAALYTHRWHQAITLLDREKAHNQAEAVIRPYNDGVLAALPADADLDALGLSSKKFNNDQRKAEQRAIDDHIHQLTHKANELQMQIRETKEYIAQQKHSFVERREAMAKERAEMLKYQPRLMEPVQTATRKAMQRLDRVHHKSADARYLLVKEVAAACNFQRRKAWNGRSEYSIGSIVIPDLRELNIKTQPSKDSVPVGSRTIAEPHDLLCEAFDNVAHLVNLFAHYLQIRPPAEIILAHYNFPRTAIVPEKSSYKASQLPTSGSNSSHSSSPAASRLLERSNMSRPRYLCLDRPLAQLAKDDQKSYGLFIEGVTLLAWDLAWLCKTQGIDNITTFEDICAVGRNLWALFNTSPRRSSHEKSQRERDIVLPSGRSNPTSDPGSDRLYLGMFSHGSAARNLSSAAGLQLMKDWKLASSARLTDRLKSYLFNEISGAEWDILDDREWDEGREDEEPVLVGGSRRIHDSRHPAMSITTIPALDNAGREKSDDTDMKKRGNSGWMKVRGRNGED